RPPADHALGAPAPGRDRRHLPRRPGASAGLRPGTDTFSSRTKPRSPMVPRFDRTFVSSLVRLLDHLNALVRAELGAELGLRDGRWCVGCGALAWSGLSAKELAARTCGRARGGCSEGKMSA